MNPSASAAAACASHPSHALFACVDNAVAGFLSATGHSVLWQTYADGICLQSDDVFRDRAAFVHLLSAQDPTRQRALLGVRDWCRWFAGRAIQHILKSEAKAGDAKGEVGKALHRRLITSGLSASTENDSVTVTAKRIRSVLPFLCGRQDGPLAQAVMDELLDCLEHADLEVPVDVDRLQPRTDASAAAIPCPAVPSLTDEVGSLRDSGYEAGCDSSSNSSESDEVRPWWHAMALGLESESEG